LARCDSSNRRCFLWKRPHPIHSATSNCSTEE
jgi:hypothetical protein